MEEKAVMVRASFRMLERQRDYGTPQWSFLRTPATVFLLVGYPSPRLHENMQLCCLYIQNNQYNMNAHYLVSLPTRYTKIKFLDGGEKILK